MTGPLAAVVFDHTALLAFGAGHPLLSGLVAGAHHETNRHVYVPAMCLAAATAIRPALADHVGSLLAMDLVDLGYTSASTVGRLLRHGVDWRNAHAIAVALPDAEWPTGRPVITELPETYRTHGVNAVRLPK